LNREVRGIWDRCGVRIEGRQSILLSPKNAVEEKAILSSGFANLTFFKFI